MTDDFEPDATAHPTTGEPEADAGPGEVGAIEYADASMAIRLPRMSDFTLENGVDAVKWGYDKLTRIGEKAPEPGGISVDIEDHEETTLRSSSVAHEDPPPPEPGETSPSHETEHRDN